MVYLHNLSLYNTGPAGVVTVPQGQVNHGYNQDPTAAMGPPSYNAGAAAPATYPPPTSPSSPGEQ